ncbi:MAG TPA: DUF305 domain-containing protein [Candidatus Elarobacter sp.]|nr:DUF305 domain-containing protein [Candidatus Elarobacter sp.]
MTVAGLLALSPAAMTAQATSGTHHASADTTRSGYTAADVQFMQGMIAHHAQALVMSALVPSHTTNPRMHLLAQRIEISQKDEIGLMRRWLEDRNERAPSVEESHTGHDMAMPGMAMSGPMMPGMLTAAQLAQLASSKGEAFDRLFLRDMISHHEGALVMVSDLLATKGAAQDPTVFQYASDVDADQRAEIARMRAMLDADARTTQHR